MRNTELRRELNKLSALAAAIADLAAQAHADSLEPAVAELAMLARATYKSLIDRAVIDHATRAEIEDREDGESRQLPYCGGRQ